MASRRKRGSRVAPSVAVVDGVSPEKPESSHDTSRAIRWVIGSILAIAVIYVIFALSPSHYSIALNKLGVPTEPLWGTASQIRSDEWMVNTPLTQIAVRGKFGAQNQISPYRESLKSFLPIPIRDWSLVFKPQLWAYWILPPAYAFSIYWCCMWLSMLAGYCLLLRQMRASWWLSVLGAGTLWMSQYVQVWWTSPAPCFALAPWPAVLFLCKAHPLIRYPAVAYTAGVWLFGFVYPPFQIPTAFMMAALVVAFRRDTLSVRSVAALACCAALAAALLYVDLRDLIAVMRETVYPGSRVSSGGGVAIVRVVSHLLPFLATSNFRSLVPRLDECEVAVVATALPLLFLCFVDYRSLAHAFRAGFLDFTVFAVACMLMLAWICLPVPAAAGKLLLWTYVPPYRMVWAFGALLTIGLVVLAGRCSFRITGTRLVVYCGITLLAWLSSRAVAQDLVAVRADTSLANSWFEFAAIAVAVIVFTGYRIASNWVSCRDATVILVMSFVTGVTTFGTYNPIQQAHVIFDVPSSELQEGFRRQAQANPNGWLVTPGTYGAVLNGVGIPSITHTLTAPQLEFFRRLFPALPDETFNQVFNRYAHTMIRQERVPRVLHQDIIGLPIDVFNQPHAGSSSSGQSTGGD